MLNVENPHKFWYRSICDDEKLQSDLSDYVSKNKVDFVPSDEQYVIVEIDNRFSVARISKVENDEKVCIQTVDGREMVIVCSNLTKLSDTKLIEVAENTMCIGSLIYISPAAKVSIFPPNLDLSKKNRHFSIHFPPRVSARDHKKS